jgi:hypothetical protein
VSQIDRGTGDQRAEPDDEHRERRGLLHRSGR